MGTKNDATVSEGHLGLDELILTPTTRAQFLGGTLRASVGAGLLAAGVAGCGASASANDRALVTASVATFDTFDPSLTLSEASLYVVAATIEPVLTYTRSPLRLKDGQTVFRADAASVDGVRGAAASKYEFVKPDLLRLTFRKNMKYTNGNPLDAEVALEGFKRQWEINPAVQGLYPIATVKSFDNFSKGPGNTVDIALETPNPFMLYFLTFAWLVDPEEVRAHRTAEDPWAKNYFKRNPPTASGPYEVTSFRAGQEILLKRNSTYYGKKPYFEEVRQRLIDDDNQRSLLVERGEVDIAFYPPVSQMERISRKEETPGPRVVSIPGFDLLEVGLQTKGEPFNDVDVRKAVAWAIPYAEIIDGVYGGYATELKSLIPKPFAGSTPSFEYTTDLDQAAASLEKAGYPNGRGLAEFTLHTSTDEDIKQTGLLIQQNLRKLGMRVNVRNLPLAAFQSQLYERKFTCWIFNFPSFTWDAFYHAYFHVDSEAFNNEVNYKNERVDALIDEHFISNDEEARLAAIAELQSIVHEDVPWIPLCGLNHNLLVQSDIRGVTLWNDAINRYQDFRRT